MKLDHLVVATPDGAAAAAEIRAATGVEPTYGGAHVPHGTCNWLASVATDDPEARVYLEVIGPDPRQPDPPGPRSFQIDELDRPSFAWWCARSDDLRTELSSIDEPFTDTAEMSRDTADGAVLRWLLAFPLSFDGAVPFAIDWIGTPHPSLGAPGGLRLERFEIGHPDPDGFRATLATMGEFPIEVHRADAIERRLVLAGPDGAIDLTSVDPI